MLAVRTDPSAAAVTLEAVALEGEAVAVAVATAEEVEEAFAFFGAGAVIAREKKRDEAMIENFMSADLVVM